MRIEDVPLNRLLEIAVDENSIFHATLQMRPEIANHVGTIHAGALMATAEAASIECLRREFERSDNVVPLLREFQAKFRRLADGDVRAIGKIERQSLEEFRAQLSRRSQGTIWVHVEVLDSTNQVCLTAEVRWFVQVMDNEPT